MHYVYVFHSMGSTHMVDHANSFDHYDTLFCAGPHQMKEIRRREELKQLPAKALYDFGHPRLEQVMRMLGEMPAARGASEPPVVLVAPTWGDTSIFNHCGEPLLRVLLDAGYRVIMRPHYHSNRLTPEVINGLREAFADRTGFEYIDRMGETESLLRSDILISDWSAMALEYALGLEKPVLFIDVPRRIRNPDWRELDIEPMESAIRKRLGEVVSPNDLERVPEVVSRLLEQPGRYSETIAALRDEVVFRLGHSVPDGAERLAEISDRCREERARRERKAKTE